MKMFEIDKLSSEPLLVFQLHVQYQTLPVHLSHVQLKTSLILRLHTHNNTEEITNVLPMISSRIRIHKNYNDCYFRFCLDDWQFQYNMALIYPLQKHIQYFLLIKQKE